MKTLLLVTPKSNYLRRSERQQQEATDEHPRDSIFEEALNADVLDSEYLDGYCQRSLTIRVLRRVVPLYVLQALIAYWIKDRYDAVVSWDDRSALAYASLLRITRSRSAHVVIPSWMVPRKKSMALKFAQRGIDRVIVRSQLQGELLIQKRAISRDRVVHIRHFADERFWRPIEKDTDSICSVGDSMRDYVTLVEAMRGLKIRCNVASSVNPSGEKTPDTAATSSGLAQISEIPDNVVFTRASFLELRELYARARFVVIPVLPTARDNGVTVIREAMAMGKAVVCSRTQGLAEFVEEGVTGTLVPPRDPLALREAIWNLWNDPELAERMGQEARKRIVEAHGMTGFSACVRQVCEAVAGAATNGRRPLPRVPEN